MPLLEVRRDVCLAHYSCGGDVARLRLVRRSSLGAGASVSTRPGLTVAVASKHGTSLDWSNLAHWASACVLVAAAARSELPGLGRFGAALAARAAEAVWVALPQVASNRTACGGASGLPALVSRGEPSEMFALLALASARVAVEALGNGSAPSRAAAAAIGGKSVLLCRDIAPGPRAYTCFDALIRARWSDAALGGRHAMLDALEAVSGRAGAAARAATGEALRSQARALLGLPAAAPEAGGRRVIVLLTRRTQSAWVNRPSVARAVSLAARAAGVRFEDAGDAEDLGRGPGGCYGAAAQVRLWSRAWLVVSVAGAHEANAVWLACGSAGLLESLNCGHATGTYRALAAATGGRYAAASEVRQQGHRWLRSASRPLLDQACVHLGLRRGCRAEEVLAARPRLYERKNCTAQRRSDALYFNLPRVHDLEGGETADLLAALHRILGLSPPCCSPPAGGGAAAAAPPPGGPKAASHPSASAVSSMPAPPARGVSLRSPPPAAPSPWTVSRLDMISRACTGFTPAFTRSSSGRPLSRESEPRPPATSASSEPAQPIMLRKEARRWRSCSSSESGAL
ncbi:hypothetical protein EMIHUDRAFT_100019 [Emiliania huxleyi CCMP1516]|uniref:Uncharacterized protein n=2 Tax=Emiliania huxleyi TaxID=2903 RepID=A0A0D3JYH4_EMIH1|nr:hypothetical protein EMIHUDRAFT_100019 [Emiliania huxleyi CCMP1516]EOD28559.1 hypothetical protein EMIHUDRAFT_100019 [Emiliania huxleyi CCMP1516]|eukprot:XP_005780988.1 hypothetical protein EMIHUDRAFT_100019 [Emiliania huxleyi CCMP1516]